MQVKIKKNMITKVGLSFIIFYLNSNKKCSKKYKNKSSVSKVNR